MKPGESGSRSHGSKRSMQSYILPTPGLERGGGGGRLRQREPLIAWAPTRWENLNFCVRVSADWMSVLNAVKRHLQYAGSVWPSLRLAVNAVRTAFYSGQTYVQSPWYDPSRLTRPKESSISLDRLVP